MKFCTDTHVPQRMNPKDVGGPLTFYLARPSQRFHLSVKYLSVCWIDWYKMLYCYSWFPDDVS